MRPRPFELVDGQAEHGVTHLHGRPLPVEPVAGRAVLEVVSGQDRVELGHVPAAELDLDVGVVGGRRNAWAG
ncbi:MAG: hypothetical protein QOE59_3921, partial [Actinomycetota bacterium]|nr:hypothetical protein [Actinomycetota bacterium]